MASQHDTQCLHILPGIIVNIPHVVGKEYECYENSEGNGYVQRFNRERLALDRIGPLHHKRSPHHKNCKFTEGTIFELDGTGGVINACQKPDDADPEDMVRTNKSCYQAYGES